MTVSHLIKRGLVYKTRWLFDEDTALSLYKVLIAPYHDYGSIIYEAAPEYQLKRLQVIQNESARLILVKLPHTSIYAMHKKLKLDTLTTRREKTMVKTTYSCIHDKELAYLYDCLEPVEYTARIT